MRPGLDARLGHGEADGSRSAADSYYLSGQGELESEVSAAEELPIGGGVLEARVPITIRVVDDTDVPVAEAGLAFWEACRRMLEIYPLRDPSESETTASATSTARSGSTTSRLRSDT